MFHGGYDTIVEELYFFLDAAGNSLAAERRITRQMADRGIEERSTTSVAYATLSTVLVASP